VSGSFDVEGTETVFRSRVFSVERRDVVKGSEHFSRDVAVHPGAVAVLALNERGEVGLIRQYRATFNRWMYEIPAGTRDVEGEEPLAAAQRELLEELGCAAQQWRLLGKFMNSPGWTNQVMWIYEATGLSFLARTPVGPEEESSTIHWMAPEELRDVLRAAEAADSTTVIALQRLFGTYFD